MEPLIVISQNSRKKSHIGSFPPRGSKWIHCRTFERSITTSVFPSFVSPQKPHNQHKQSSPITASVFPSFVSPQKPHNQRKQSSPIPINPTSQPKTTTPTSDTNDLSNPELWAGPAYSNSPEPSSLPIPKFSLREKRSTSLNLPPHSPPDYKLPLFAKSAPSSPTRDSPATDFLFTAASATENLRRILNLDLTDD